MPEPEQSGAHTDLGQDRPHGARIYDYLLGGSTHYAVDRRAGDELTRAFHPIETTAKVNRAFGLRAVRRLVRLGVRQFVDVGTGLPHAPHLHDEAQAIAPECRFVHVDNDPLVIVYADELLHGTPEGRTERVRADATDPSGLWEAVTGLGVLDPGSPVALILHGLLHLVPDGRAHESVARLLEPLPPGSYLSLSHCTGDFAPREWRAVAEVCARYGTPLRVRGHAEVAAFFDGLEPVGPGLVPAHRWFPEPGSGPGVVSDRQASLYAGVARKP
ncbi:SAM-dependent methyltransferase [Streptomyces sp. SID8352]|uniref:SAM-dependent methyltransferase n=1 Tax=Streptomyces sp. SID8352 TaxID=2690338 RepID=UPI00136C279D|nr:SAM-dependent methyltransferase [Streptomyces sp. SID8352]